MTSLPATTATVSGSFQRALPQVQTAIAELTSLGVTVLSPADARVVDSVGEFVFVASDRVRLVRAVQARHLAAISASDFLWLVAPEGYVGVSAAMEIGYAAACQIPVYALNSPTDITLRQWVRVVANISEAVHNREGFGPRLRMNLLLDPHTVIEAAHADLSLLREGLLGDPSPEQTQTGLDAAARLRGRLIIP
jgi:nucleoside 2-deoxyribosyltransferase